MIDFIHEVSDSIRFSCMRNFVIVLDGPKGAGKTTLASLLKEKLENVEILSLDVIRRSLPQAKATTEFNHIAFALLLERLPKLLEEKKNVVIDMGLSEERFNALKRLAQEYNTSVKAYSLIAPRETLLERVEARDKREGKTTNEERFQEVYEAQQAKSFHEFIILDTSKLVPEEMVHMIAMGVNMEYSLPKPR